MQVKVSGKGITVGDSLQSFVKDEIGKIVSKYIGSCIESSIIVGKNNRLFITNIALHISRGFFIKGSGESDDPYKSVSIATEKLEARIKKHKNRIKDQNKRNRWAEDGYVAKDYVVERKYQNNHDNNDDDEEHLIIAEQEKHVLLQSVSEAVAKLDLGDWPVVMFKNVENQRINVVYKRSDGHIGWIDYSDN
jgi:ribosomal subunit interface protein